MGTDYPHHGEYCMTYRIVESLCCTSETKRRVYGNYTSIINKQINKSSKPGKEGVAREKPGHHSSGPPLSASILSAEDVSFPQFWGGRDLLLSHSQTTHLVEPSHFCRAELKSSATMKK